MTDILPHIVVHLVLAAAAFMQGVTGIGFALIATPALLIALNDPAAVPIAGLLSLTIAIVMAPGTLGLVDRRLLWRFTTTALIFAPLGVLLYATASPTGLKLVAGATVGVLTLAIVFGVAAVLTTEGRPTDLTIGGVSGVLAGALGMPGPPASLRLTALNRGKERSRATIQAFFIIMYPLVVVAQTAASGGGADAVIGGLVYVPATLIGAFGGRYALDYVSERLFRNIVIVVLLATAASLVLDAGRGMVGG